MTIISDNIREGRWQRRVRNTVNSTESAAGTSSKRGEKRNLECITPGWSSLDDAIAMIPRSPPHFPAMRDAVWHLQMAEGQWDKFNAGIFRGKGQDHLYRTWYSSKEVRKVAIRNGTYIRLAPHFHGSFLFLSQTTLSQTTLSLIIPPNLTHISQWLQLHSRPLTRASTSNQLACKLQQFPYVRDVETLANVF